MNRLKVEWYRQLDVIFPECQLAVLYWGDEQGVLEKYLPLKILPLDYEGKGKYEFCTENRIPEGATRLWAVGDFCMENAVFAEIPLEYRTDWIVPEAVFYVVSDIHTITKNSRQQLYQIRAWEHISRERADFVLLAGDITNGMQPTECEKFRRGVEQTLPEIPLFQTFGNHDFHANHGKKVAFPEKREELREWFYERNKGFGAEYTFFDDYSYCATMKGLRIISLQGMDYKDKIYSVGEELIQWLEKRLLEAKGELTIVFSHYPLTTGERKIYLKENTKLCRLLESYGNILYFYGHIHDSLDSDLRTIRQKGTVVYLNDASVGNTEPCPRERRALKDYRDEAKFPQLEDYFGARGMGLRVEVSKEALVVRGIDFEKERYIPRCFMKEDGGPKRLDVPCKRRI